MKMLKQKQKYIPLKGIMGNGDDYHVYKMRFIDYIIGYSIGFLIAAVVIYVFFKSLYVAVVIGLLCGLFSIKWYQKYRLKKRLDSLLLEFRDLLEALTTSYSSGRNTMDAFSEAYQDLLNLHGEQADIVKEVHIILTGITNNMIIENMLNDFAQRSGLDDVASFASIFESSNRLGGNIKQIVWDTRKIINDKIEVEMEIKTMLAEKENELNIMMVMPLVVMIGLGGLGTMTAASNTPLNIIIKIIVIIVFVFSYIIGRKIIDIKV